MKKGQRGRAKLSGRIWITLASLGLLLVVALFVILSRGSSKRETAPKFSLPSVRGEMVSLDDYLGQKSVVLVFYRGAS